VHAPKKKGPKPGVLLWLGIWILSLIPGRADTFQEAGALYESGKFSESKKVYEQLVASGPWNANLFYNLGNVEFRLGGVGKAALNFERALVLEPDHKEAARNLDFVRKHAGAPIPPLQLPHFIVSFVGVPGLLAVATVCGWLLIFCTTRLLTGSRASGLWWSALFGLLVGGVAGTCLWNRHRDAALAIITQPQVDARAQPADRSPLAAPLLAGTRVRVISELGEWCQCELPNQGRGWIPAIALEKIDLRPPANLP
jgi:tetratricopeptide (TPR) repeat protein